jgi:hypothetical protein
MTNRELNQLHYIKREKLMWQRKLDKINNRSTVASPIITGMPRSTVTRNALEDDTVEKVEIETIIKGLRAKAQRQEREILKYINSIDDSFIRQIMVHRHIDCMSWVGVAMEMGGGNTADGVRKAHDRFLQRK